MSTHEVCLPSFPADFVERGETVWALIFVGYDQNTPREYSVLITLAPMPAGDKE
ncbi:MAG: hypothetical protein H0T75_08035 [Rhizobiales bacterium]|nr:hypothetical protein [Hyphomicrobiales bacterium]